MYMKTIPIVSYVQDRGQADTCQCRVFVNAVPEGGWPSHRKLIIFEDVKFLKSLESFKNSEFTPLELAHRLCIFIYRLQNKHSFILFTYQNPPWDKSKYRRREIFTPSQAPRRFVVQPVAIVWFKLVSSNFS